MFFVQPALALVRTRRSSFLEFYYVFSLYFFVPILFLNSLCFHFIQTQSFLQEYGLLL